MADNQSSETTNQGVVNTPVAPAQDKKRVIKKKVLKIKKVKTTADTPVETTQETQVDEQVAETEDEKDLTSIIPSSRIKNYINKEKLNKEIDTLIQKIKDADLSLDLNSILSEDVQKKIGSSIKDKEKLNQEAKVSPDTPDVPYVPIVINVNEIAVDILSKQRFKFSNNSFKVLSVFSDMIIEEITKFAMDELVKHKKSIINNKYVFSSDISSGKLYKIYSELPSFIAMRNETSSTQDVPDTSEDVDEPTETEQVSTDKTSKGINFEFYIRKICNKLKVSDEVYSKIKVSEKYQKFCSNIILDFLDRVAPLSKIVLEVMTTKTITNLVFQTVIKMKLLDTPDYEGTVQELQKRLDTQKK
jgi:hypothetical protein